MDCSYREDNTMKKMDFIIVVLIIFSFTALSAEADTRYVTDSFTITLRTGPSTENKIIRMLNSGQALEVLESMEKWSHVKLTLKNGEEQEGWVRNQYLIDRTPYAVQTRALQSENQRLKESVSKLNQLQTSTEGDRKDISAQYNQTLSELTTLKKDYESLKRASSEYLSLKAEYDENLAKLKTTEETLNEVKIENSSIKNSKNYIWFGTGALVLLFGLIIGSILGRQSRKRSSSYY